MALIYFNLIATSSKFTVYRMMEVELIAQRLLASRHVIVNLVLMVTIYVDWIQTKIIRACDVRDGREQ